MDITYGGKKYKILKYYYDTEQQTVYILFDAKEAFTLFDVYSNTIDKDHRLFENHLCNDWGRWYHPTTLEDAHKDFLSCGRGAYKEIDQEEFKMYLALSHECEDSRYLVGHEQKPKIFMSFDRWEEENESN